MDQRLGRPVSPAPKMDQRIAIPMTRDQRRALERAARRAGYASVAAFARERCLAAILSGTRGGDSAA